VEHEDDQKLYCLVKERADISFLCMFSWGFEKIFKW